MARLPAGKRDLYLLCRVQTGFEIQAASSQILTEGFFLRAKLTTHLRLMRVCTATLKYIVTISVCVCVRVWTGYGLDVGFIDHLYIQLGTTSNYSATPDLHTLQITTAHAKTFPACCVFNSRFLVTASNSGDSSSSCAQFIPSTFQYRTNFQLSTELIAPFLFFIIPRRGPHRQHHGLPVCLRNRCRGDVFTLFVSRSMPSNGSVNHNIVIGR
jgi:hypothetical protein